MEPNHNQPMVGFIGLGVMGSRMAGHLAAAGQVLVWNRTPSRATGFERVASSLAEVAEECDVVCICVSRTEDVEEVLGAMSSKLRSGMTIVDHSTIEPSAAREMARTLGAQGVGFVDAPVTGGEKGAEDGTLTIFCGGEEDDFRKALPFMEAYGKKIRLVGPSGSGQMMKMANQVSVVGCVLAMAECLAFVDRAGLDMAEAIDLIGSGAGGSWSLTNYGPKVLARDWSPGFSIDLQQKDLRYALDAAREMGLSLPGAILIEGLFGALQEQGRGGEATPALFEVIEGKTA
jgi:3-hydroxyisobutyrate dehydrogenase-like beta-hydroxyacid dehydrogenase